MSEQLVTPLMLVLILGFTGLMIMFWFLMRSIETLTREIREDRSAKNRQAETATTPEISLDDEIDPVLSGFFEETDLAPTHSQHQDKMTEQKSAGKNPKDQPINITEYIVTD